MKFKPFHPFHLVALATAIALPAFAQAGTPPLHPLVDSTGVAKTATSTMQPGLNITDVKTIAGAVAGDIITNNTYAIPPGYREIVTAMASHFLGSADAGLAAAGYYYGLNYPTVVMSGGSYALGASGLSATCGTDSTPRVVVLGYSGVQTEGGTSSVPPSDYYVCEPLGSRSTLEKIVGATVVSISSTTINSYKLAGTLGVNTGAATAICQSLGYTNFVQGTLAYTPWGSGCNDSELITQYRNGAWVSDTACYNQLMSGAQCWK